MDKKIAILQYFMEDPTGSFHIREIARLARLNHMTVRSSLNSLVQEGFLLKKKAKLYPAYMANPDKKFKNLKRYCNLERLRESKLIEDLEEQYDYPVIILFGSYASATNTKESDVDLLVITNIQKKQDLQKYEKALGRKISLSLVTEKEFNRMKTKNKELVNNLCNGEVLSGKLEVI